jgi:hypothetical protein
VAGGLLGRGLSPGHLEGQDHRVTLLEFGLEPANPAGKLKDAVSVMASAA